MVIFVREFNTQFLTNKICFLDCCKLANYINKILQLNQFWIEAKPHQLD